jgi:hypothetical protein
MNAPGMGCDHRANLAPFPGLGTIPEGFDESGGVE